MISSNKNKLYIGIIFFIICLVITLTWFRDGLYYGGAEVGILGYNSARFLDLQKYIWWGGVAPGMLVPQFVVGAPFYFVLSILQSFLPSLTLQIIIYFLLLFITCYGMYFFSLSILGKEKSKYAFIAGIFYMFNSYMMVAVWHRFLYTGIFLAAALPALALLWKLWIDKGKLIFLTLFLAANLLFVYMYGNLSSVLVVWILCFLLTVVRIIFPWQGRRNALVYMFKFFVGFSLFLFTNFWWLIPVFKVSAQVLPQQHNIEDNLGTLINISKQTILPFSLQYANPFYLFYTQEIGKIYTNFIFLILSWMPISLIAIGLFSSLKKKYLASISLFYLIAIVLAKGVANPFGYPYIWTFMKIFAIGVIRNPFEKLGILMPFFGSLFFVIGLENLVFFSKRKYGNFIPRLLTIVFVGSVLIYAFPMFTGGVFNKPDHSLKVKVPTSYEQANEWFIKQGDQEGNILHLPFSGGDVVTYKWENGYHGVGINEILFTALPSITRNVGVKRIDDTLGSLKYIFTSPYSQNQLQILETLQNFNVKFIVLHKDLDWQDKDTYGDKGVLFNPMDIEKVLNSLSFLEKKQQFGDLIIYKLTDQYYKPILAVAKDVQLVYPGEAEIMQILSIKEKNIDTVTPILKNKEDFLKSRTIFIFPEKRIDSQIASDSAMIAKINNIFTNQSPEIQQLIEMRNYFSSVGYLESSNLVEDLILATQDLLGIYGLAAQNKVAPSTNQFNHYETGIKRFFEKYSENLSIHLLFKGYVTNQLKMHIFILRQLGQENTAKIVENFMTDKELLPVYKDIRGMAFKFTIPQKGTYRLIYPAVFKDAETTINGVKITSKENIELEEGKKEITLYGVNQGNDIALKLKATDKPISGGRILSIIKESPVKYTGKIIIDKPSFIMFSQSYHPGWVLTLSKEGTKSEIRDHLMGNLYNNSWWLSEVGEFDYNIEFIPQQTVSNGLAVSLLSWFGLLIGTTFIILKSKFDKKI